jgi:GT2 family glycosyltransferase
MSKLAIIVLNWNGWRDTNACIESLFALENENLHLYLCDNASSNDSVVRIREWLGLHLEPSNQKRLASGRTGFELRDLFDHSPAPDPAAVAQISAANSLTLLQTGRNGGYAFGNNVGLRQALNDDCDYFWVINNDTEVEPDALTWLCRRMAADPKVGICGSTLVYAGQRDTIQTWGGSAFKPLRGWAFALGAFKKRTDPIDAAAVEAEMTYVNGASMFVSRKFLEQVGLMKEDYFLYWEEIEWAKRARGRFVMGYAPQSIVYHKVGATIGTQDSGESSPLSDYYMIRNQVRFCLQYSRISLPFVVFDIGRNVVRSLRRKRPKRVATLLRALFGLPFVPSR